MIINENAYKFNGMPLQDGIEEGYRSPNGAVSMYYLAVITKKLEADAKSFELALKQFHYHFPLEGEYQISWKIERIDNDN